jgi:transposase, IS30 family
MPSLENLGQDYMAQTYKQLTYDDRCQIYALKSIKMSHRRIAFQLNICSSTVDREVKRNSGLRGYRFKQADRLSKARRTLANSKVFKMTPALIAEIETFLTLHQWSPEQICGHFKTREVNPVSLSHETIYAHIIADKAKNGTLYLSLRRKSRRYQPRIKGKTSRGQICNRVPIEAREAVANNRERLGDYEADSVIGRGHKSAIMTLVCRKSRFTIIRKVPKKRAEEVKNALIDAIITENVPIHTITFDNGKEFAFHEQIAQKLGAKTYFANPYSSWERGTNENTNGLIRQYFPKQTDFDKVSAQEMMRVQNLLNNRPRKILNFQTPSFIMRQIS